VVDAESEVIAGGVPGAGPIVNRTTLEISVVVVADEVFGLVVPDTAEPGISTAICTVPGVVKFDAGTGAVSCVPLTNVVVRAVPFHRISAPETKPAPFAVIVKPCAPALTVLGLTKDSTEADVWTLRFVLNSEHAEASPHATSATISHLREHIRTRSSRPFRRQSGQAKAGCGLLPETAESMYARSGC